MSDDITGDLDLLGDWLDAKGYTEEAGLCTRAMDFIHKQSAENEKLRAALKPFAELALHIGSMSSSDGVCVYVSDLRAAAAALKETEQETDQVKSV